MKILYINNSFRLFSGLDSGASNRSNMFVRALSKLGQVDVISFLGEEMSNIDNCAVVFVMNLPPNEQKGRLSKFKKLFQFTHLENIFPVSKQKEKIIDKFIQSKNYDYIAVRYVQEASEDGLFKYRNRLIIDVDDNPKSAVLMQAKTAKTLRNRIYSYLFAQTLSFASHRELSNVFCCFHSNPNQSPTKESVYLHNVSCLTYHNADITDSTPMRLLIVGLFHYGPNLQGVEHFLSCIFPIIRKSNPKISSYCRQNTFRRD